MSRLSREEMESQLAALLRTPDKAREFAAAADRALEYYLVLMQSPNRVAPRMRATADRIELAATRLAKELDDAPTLIESLAAQGAFFAGLPPVDFHALREQLETIADGLKIMRADIPEQTLPKHKNDARDRLIAMLARDFERITGRRAGVGPQTIFNRALAVILAHDGPHLANEAPDYSEWIRSAIRHG